MHANRSSAIAEIARSLAIPVIANGGSREMTCNGDIEAFRTLTGVFMKERKPFIGSTI